jgi:hypothetical protein
MIAGCIEHLIGASDEDGPERGMRRIIHEFAFA